MPEDRITYSELNKTTWSRTPQLVRWRQRFRGTRDSEKVNLEMNQGLYDVYHLDKRINTVITGIETLRYEYDTGKSYGNAVEYYYASTDATPSYHDPSGLTSLKQRVNELDKRIKLLEGE